MQAQIGCLVADLQGKSLSQEEAELLAHPLVAGVVLFTRNYESVAQITALCRQIHAARTAPLLIFVDQEGGRVQRFIAEFTRLPKAAAFGDLYDRDPTKATLLAKNCGWLLAAELLHVGVDLSLAPVVDLKNGESGAIGDRAFHRDPEVVVTLAKAFISGMNEAGMAAVLKHFPGHGSVTVDSHLALPIDKRSLDEIMQSDLKTFKELIQFGVQAVMSAHILFENVDDKLVSYSAVWLQEILRKQLHFRGTIFSDDLNMAGANISASYKDRFLSARASGCDLILLCNNRLGVTEILDQVPYEAHQLTSDKWQHLRGKSSNLKEKWQQNSRYESVKNELLELR